MHSPSCHTHCPLCGCSQSSVFHQDKNRPYLRCERCSLIFVPPTHYLSPQAEKAEYDLHENSPTDVGYRRFLSRIFEPLNARLAPNSSGLDFGCGPGPTLSVLFEEAGHTVAIYDPFYANHPNVFEQTYDFITATEVVEHLHAPRQEIDRLWNQLRPSGFLGFMTKLALDQAAFASWHYKADLTHVCFFSQETFHWLAHSLQADLTIIGQDVILLQKHYRSSEKYTKEERKSPCKSLT